MFERTRAGQENRAEFLGVEVVCYVEGGGDPNSACPDITFWSTVFEELCPNRTFRCVPKGGKPILESLAREIVAGNLSNVVVAMDADYDLVTGELISDSRVLYTWGYSWENDVFNDKTLELIFEAVSHRGRCSEQLVEYLSSGMADTVSKLKWCVKGDHMALCRGASLLPRKSPGRLIVAREDAEGLEIRRSEAVRMFREVRAKLNAKPIKGEVRDYRRHLVGKYLHYAALLILRGAFERFHRKVAISPDTLRDLGLQLFRRFLQIAGGHPVRSHYVRHCAQMPV